MDISPDAVLQRLKKLKKEDIILAYNLVLNQEKIEEHSIEVHFLENEGDELLNKTVAELFNLKDVITITKDGTKKAFSKSLDFKLTM